MDTNTELYYQAALELGLPVDKDENLNFMTISFGKRKYLFHAGLTSFNDAASSTIASNKYIMNKLLTGSGIPMPKALALSPEYVTQKKAVIAALTYPLVAKPLQHTVGGEDVLCNIPDQKRLEQYLTEKFKKHKFILLEEFYANLKTYRVLVYFGKVIGVVLRLPAKIVGDGTHSIKQLVDIENEKRLALIQQWGGKGYIKLDEEAESCLAHAGLSFDDVINKDETVWLGYTATASRGGSFEAITQKIHPDNASLAIRAAKILNVNLVGFDVMCHDISQPLLETGGVFIEANTHPDINIHINPMRGHAEPTAKVILKHFKYKHPLRYAKARIKNFFGRSLALRIVVSLAIFLVFFWLFEHFFL